MTDTADVVDAADRAFALVEAVDEAWLYRYASQSVLKADDTTDQSVMCRPGAPAELLVYDRAEPEAWIQGEFRAVGR
jgi:hypothetical protein